MRLNLQQKIGLSLALFISLLSLLSTVKLEAADFELDKSIAPPSITQLAPDAGSVNVTWQASSSLESPAIRVDAGGNGDSSTISEALGLVDAGIVAVAMGTYEEESLHIPDNVTLQGGYDAESWAWSAENKTTLQAAGGSETFISFGKGAGLKGFVISAPTQCVKNLRDGAIISNNVFQLCTTGLFLGANSYTELKNNTFLGQETAVYVTGSASLVADNNVFSGVGESFKNESSTSELSLGDFLDEEPAELGLSDTSPFPPDSGPEIPVDDWSIELRSDSSEKDEVSDVFRASEPFTALYLECHLGEGDRVSIHAKDHYDLSIFDSFTIEARDFAEWVQVPEAQEIRLRLRTNGDGNMGTSLKDGIEINANTAQIKAIGQFKNPEFELDNAGSEAEGMGATASTENAGQSLSFPDSPSKLPSMAEIEIEEKKVAYLEELIENNFKDNGEYRERLLLEGEDWTSFSEWPKRLAAGKEYVSKSPYEVADGRRVDALLSSVFANSQGEVRRVLLGESGSRLIPFPFPEGANLQEYLDANNLQLATLTDWLKHRLQESCFSEGCYPNTDFKYYVKPLTEIGESDCVDKASCPLSPLQERVLEIHPFAGFLNRTDLYDYEQEGYPIEFYVTDSDIVSQNDDGIKLSPRGDPPYAGPLPDGDKFDINDPATIHFIYPEPFTEGRFQAEVTGTVPEYGKRTIFGIGDTRYEKDFGDISPFDAWRSWIGIRKYTGVTSGKFTAGNEDAYDHESFLSYAGWDANRWYRMTIDWGEGRALLKREPLADYGEAPLGNDLQVDDQGGRSPDNGRRHPDFVSAYTWEYPGKLTADRFWMASASDKNGVPVKGTYNDVKIFAGAEDLNSEMYLRHDRVNAEMVFDTASLRGSENYADRDVVPEGAIVSGEIYVHIASLNGFEKISLGEELVLEKKILAGKTNLTLVKGSEVLASIPLDKVGISLSEEGRLELKWSYNNSTDQTSYFVYYSLDNANDEQLLMASTERYAGKSLPGIMDLDAPSIKIKASRVGPAKLVLRHMPEAATGVTLDKEISTSGEDSQTVGYKIYYSQDRDEVFDREQGIFVSPLELGDPAAPSYLLTDLAEDERYYLALSTVIVGEETRESTLSEVVSFVTSPQFDFMAPEPRPSVVDEEMRAAAEEEDNQQTAWDFNFSQKAYADEETESFSDEIAVIYELGLGESITLDAALSAEASGTKSQWSMGSTPPTSHANHPEKTYVYPGNYIARMEVEDEQGAKKISYSDPVLVEHSEGAWIKPSVSVWVPEDETWEGIQEAEELHSRNYPVVGVDQKIYITGEVLDLANTPTAAAEIVWDLDGKMLTWDGTELSIDGADDVQVWNPDIVLADTVNYSQKLGEVLQATPLVVSYEKPGLRVISLMTKDDEGNIGVYEYSVYVTSLSAYPAEIGLSSAQGGMLTIQGGAAPWKINNELLEEGVFEKFMTFTPGSTIEIEDSVENSLEIDIANEAGATLNKFPSLEISDKKSSPGNEAPMKVRFFATSSDQDGYILSEAPWVFGDSTPHQVQALLPEVQSQSEMGEESEFTIGPFENMGKFPATLTLRDASGNEKARTVLIKVGAPDLSMRDVLGVTASAVSKIEFFKRKTDKSLEKVGETIPDKNGMFVTPVTEEWTVGKQGIAISGEESFLFTLFSDLSYQREYKLELEALADPDNLGATIVFADEVLGEVNLTGDPNQDIVVVEEFDYAKDVPQIKLERELELDYKGLYTDFYDEEEKLFTFYNKGGLSLEEELSVRVQDQEEDMKYLQFEILAGEKPVATLFFPSAQDVGNNLKTSEGVQTTEVDFSSASLRPGDQVFVAVYDAQGHKYQYRETFVVPETSLGFQSGSLGIADQDSQSFFGESKLPAINSPLPSFFGVISPNSEISITIESEKQEYLLQSDSSGSFSLVPEYELEEGEHKVTFEWKGVQESYDFLVDWTAPESPRATGLQGGKILTGTAEAGTTVVAYSYGFLEETANAEVLADGSFTLNFAESNTHFRLMARDSAGNFSESVEVEFEAENVTAAKGWSFLKLISYAGLIILLIAVIGLIRNKKKNDYY